MTPMRDLPVVAKSVESRASRTPLRRRRAGPVVEANHRPHLVLVDRIVKAARKRRHAEAIAAEPGVSRLTKGSPLPVAHSPVRPRDVYAKAGKGTGCRMVLREP